MLCCPVAAEHLVDASTVRHAISCKASTHARVHALQTVLHALCRELHKVVHHVGLHYGKRNDSAPSFLVLCYVAAGVHVRRGKRMKSTTCRCYAWRSPISRRLNTGEPACAGAAGKSLLTCRAGAYQQQPCQGGGSSSIDRPGYLYTLSCVYRRQLPGVYVRPQWCICRTVLQPSCIRYIAAACDCVECAAAGTCCGRCGRRLQRTPSMQQRQQQLQPHSGEMRGWCALKGCMCMSCSAEQAGPQ